MRLMVGRIKLRLSVLHSIWFIAKNQLNCYGVLTRGLHFNDFAKSHHNLTYQIDKQDAILTEGCIDTQGYWSYRHAGYTAKQHQNSLKLK